MSQTPGPRRGRSRSRLVCVAASLACVLAGCSSTPSSVDRVHDGRVWRGRYIHSFSYALYARGVHLEAQGHLREAEAAYLEAANHDPQSGSAWARIGAVRCLRGDEDAAVEAFAEGWRTDNDRTLLLLERGRCALRAEDFEAALRDGRAAVARSPRSIEASLLTIDALQGLRRDEEATRWLDALAAFAPGARHVHAQRASHAQARGDVSRERRARERGLAVISWETLEHPIDDPEVEVRGAAAIDAALQRGDLELAVRRAALLGMRGAEVALRAVALGRPELARRQAEVVLAADPDEANGRVALYLADELLGSAARTPPQGGQRGAPPSSGAPLRSSDALHPLAVMLFGELLDRRVGPLAGELWREAHPLTPSADYLVERVRGRQRASAGLPDGDDRL